MKYPLSSKGFTLIELLIAIGIFSIFIVIITGVFSRFVEVERHSIAQGALILDVQSAVESFIKEARTGYGSTYAPVLTNNKALGITFRNQEGVCVGYRVNKVTVAGRDRGVFERAENRGNTSGDCNTGSFNSGYTALTSNGTNISEVFFDAEPSDVNGTLLKSQGVITLSMTATPMKSDILPISIQNTVTSRQVRVYDK